MAKFSKRSTDRLNSCHPDIRMLFEKVVKEYDCSILEGLRSDARQAELFRQGLSKLDGHAKKSKHQASGRGPFSEAVDVSPYPIPKNWGEGNSKEKAKFYHFAGYVLGVSDLMGIEIRWGGDWDSDNEFTDQTFDDLVHFELV